MLEARHQNVVVQEWDSSCGAAALATILRFQLGDPVTERSVAIGILRRTDPDRVRGRGGFSLLDLKRFAETRGFAADGYAGLTNGQLLRLAPAIVPIKSHSGDHFVVFRGVVGGQAVLADPAFGNRSVPFTQFQSQWKARLGFVVKPRARSGANRLLPSRNDLLRVEDEAARMAMDDSLPKPLADWQLAQAFAVEPSAQTLAVAAAMPKVEKDGRNPAASVPTAMTATAEPVAGTASLNAPPVSTSTSPVSTATSTTTSTISNISSTAPTLLGATSTVLAAPSTALPAIGLPLPVSPPAITLPPAVTSPLLPRGP